MDRCLSVVGDIMVVVMDSDKGKRVDNVIVKENETTPLVLRRKGHRW